MVYECGEQGWSQVPTEAFLGEKISRLGFAFKYSVGGGVRMGGWDRWDKISKLVIIVEAG